mgnify:FL=1
MGKLANKSKILLKKDSPITWENDIVQSWNDKSNFSNQCIFHIQGVLLRA